MTQQSVRAPTLEERVREQYEKELEVRVRQMELLGADERDTEDLVEAYVRSGPARRRRVLEIVLTRDASVGFLSRAISRVANRILDGARKSDTRLAELRRIAEEMRSRELLTLLKFAESQIKRRRRRHK